MDSNNVGLSLMREPREQRMGSRQLLGYNPQMLGSTMGGVSRPLGGGSSVLVSEPRNIARKEYVGIPATALTAGAVADVTLTPQRLFRGDKLILLPDAVGLILDDILTENRSVAAGAGGVPVEAFGPTVYDNNLQIYTVQIGGQIVFRFRNPTGGTINVSGVIIGNTVSSS